MKKRLGQCVRYFLFVAAVVCIGIIVPQAGRAAPYAALVMDARTGEVLHSRNADTRLHPASLTKMMTLYIAFEAIRRGEISLDTVVTISRNAAAEPPSRLGLKPGQKIRLRYLIRAAAIKSANDAATAIGEAISGSETAFARRMNRTAKALGMTRTTFRNASGLTAKGHLSTARDMAILGRHLLYDFPEYYNLFSRRTADAGIRRVANTNRKFLAAYKGADGIKTGYTRAAGFNLVASAERGNVRIIGVLFGGRSTASRNARMAELLDMGFRRAPGHAPLRKPEAPVYAAADPATAGAAGKTIRIVTAVRKSPRPLLRPQQAPPQELLLAMQDDIRNAVQQARETPPAPSTGAKPAAVRPAYRPLTRTPPETEAAVAVAMAETRRETPPETGAETASVKQDTPRISPAAIETAVASAIAEEAAPVPAVARAAIPATSPRARPASSRLVLAATRPEPPAADDTPIVVTRISSSGGRLWGINIGRFDTRHKAERILLKTALAEMSTLDGSLRKVVQRGGGYDANFVGLNRETADLACRRLIARGIDCTPFGPS